MQNSNVDEAELAKFAQLAHEWWNTDGALKTLHDLNPLRMKFIQQHITLNNKLTLDVGCGGGILSESLAKAGSVVTAIDLESNALNAAKQHAQLQNLIIDYQCINDVDFAATHQNYFDVITCMELLEHVPQPQQIIRSCSQMLKPGGKLFLSTINRTLKAYTLAILGAEYILKLLPKNTHAYNKFIRPSELAAWLRHADLTIVEIKGVKYNPLLRHATFTSDVDINYLVACEKT